MRSIMEQSHTVLDRMIDSAMLVIPYRPGFGLNEFSQYGDVLHDALSETCSVAITSPFDTDLDGNVALFVGC